MLSGTVLDQGVVPSPEVGLRPDLSKTEPEVAPGHEDRRKKKRTHSMKDREGEREGGKQAARGEGGRKGGREKVT